jgi:hypothetical protein
LLPGLGGGRVVRDLAVVRSDPWLLQAIAVETSGFSSKRFTLVAFAIPLYVPTSHIYFTYGDRIGSLADGAEVWWTTDSDRWQERAGSQAVEEASSFFGRIHDPCGLARYIEHDRVDSDRRDPRIQETLAYSWFLCGETAKWSAPLTEARTMAGALDAPWAREVIQRIVELEFVATRGSDRVIALLAAWKDQSELSLRLVG